MATLCLSAHLGPTGNYVLGPTLPNQTTYAIIGCSRSSTTSFCGHYQYASISIALIMIIVCEISKVADNVWSDTCADWSLGTTFTILELQPLRFNLRTVVLRLRRKANKWLFTACRGTSHSSLSTTAV